MSDSIETDELDKAIEETLKQQFSEIKTSIVKTTNKVGRKTKEKIIAKSPIKSGYYFKGWQMKKLNKEDDSLGRYEVVVHNAKSPQLVHLLELGHGGGHGGTQRFKAYPHVRPAEEEAAKEYYEEIQKVLSED